MAQCNRIQCACLFEVLSPRISCVERQLDGESSLCSGFEKSFMRFVESIGHSIAMRA